jgi:hypothetical protein
MLLVERRISPTLVSHLNLTHKSRSENLGQLLLPACPIRYPGPLLLRYSNPFVQVPPPYGHATNVQGDLFMKRLLVIAACALVFAAFGPVPAASAHWWPWKHHSKTAAANGDTKPAKAKKAKKSKAAREDNRSTGASGPLYTVPKSVGWWHKGPGPAGAGVK